MFLFLNLVSSSRLPSYLVVLDYLLAILYSVWLFVFQISFLCSVGGQDKENSRGLITCPANICVRCAGDAYARNLYRIRIL